MAKKASGGPRWVLVILKSGEVRAVAASESNSQAEYRRLRTRAKNLVTGESWAVGTDDVKLILVMEPEQLSNASLITDLDIDEWLKEKKNKTSNPEVV
jgi:hypothetical protein